MPTAARKLPTECTTKQAQTGHVGFTTKRRVPPSVPSSQTEAVCARADLSPSGAQFSIEDTRVVQRTLTIGTLKSE